jgi:hypothetical protein
MKPKNWLNMPLNVANSLTIDSGRNCPSKIPATMAMMIRGSNGSFLISFIVVLWSGELLFMSYEVMYYKIMSAI